MALANKVAVADRLSLGDVETLPIAIEKGAQIVSRGLEHVAAETATPASEVLERASLEYLFRVGASLDPDTARPEWLTRVQQDDAGSDEEEG